MIAHSNTSFNLKINSKIKIEYYWIQMLKFKNGIKPVLKVHDT